MAIGMTYDEYWNGDNYLPYYYAEAHKLKTEMANQQVWLQGLYIYDAMGVVLANAFGKGKREKYMKEPIDLFPERTAKRKQEEQIDRTIAFFNKLKRDWDNRHKET